MLGPLIGAGLREAYHCTPLHYLPLIFRTGRISSKQELIRSGFTKSHFRSTSRRQDIARGFEDFAHLALVSRPAILLAKLESGFPHVVISVSTEAIEKHEYVLCRYNIARCRTFLGSKVAPSESNANGRYVPGLKLPVASSDVEKATLLKHNPPDQVEVLIRTNLWLPREAAVTVFCQADYQAVLRIGEVGPQVIHIAKARSYPARSPYRHAVMAAMDRSIADETWKGDGLEFDRV